MEGIGLVTLGWVIAICLIGGLLIGYLIGHFLSGGKKQAAAAEQAVEAHENYRDEVREHFEQTSQIMSRMVDDYRQMYEHVSEGAGKLANIYPERVVTPPPAPEAITANDQDDVQTRQPDGQAAQNDGPGVTDSSHDATAGDGTDQQRVAEDEKARARRLSGNPT